MKVTVFNGSPRGEDGNTHWMAREFAAGAEAAGAEAEHVFLVEHEIGYCRGCFACWTKSPGQCVIPDDMSGLLEKVTASDVLVFATPLYVDNVTGIMKTFFDRLIPMADPHFNTDNGDECVHPQRWPRPLKMVAISNAGFPEQSHFQVLRLLFRRMARNFHAELAGEIYRGAGETFRSAHPLLKPLFARYKHLLRKAGRELAESGRISVETQNALEKPLVPKRRYIAAANRHWDEVMVALEDQD